MRILCIDIETYYDSQYTLKKETIESYVRSPRFELQCLCGQWLDTGERFTAEESGARALLDRIDWANTGVLCHNTAFDGLILSHHYGVRPRLWLDTLSMARAVRGNHLSASLAALAKDIGLDEKTVPYEDMRGVHWCNMSEGLKRRVLDGCARDVKLTISVFKTLLVGFPREELRVIDHTIRMFVGPQLIGDVKQFRAVQGAEWTRKNEALLDLGVAERDLQSSASFCRLLEAEGVEVEMKKTAAGVTPAVAKSDFFMAELLEHPNPRVVALATARLDLKSTLEETRAGRLASLSERGPLTVQLNYAGAHTLRWSGAGKLNFQNLPREGGLRAGVMAPPGHKLVIVDLAQIELRVLCWLAGEHDFVRAVAAGDDVYSALASEIYDKPVNKKDNYEERMVGKTATLGAGYGCGPDRFAATVFGQTGERIDDAFARRVIETYRRAHPGVTALWRRMDHALPILAHGSEVLFAVLPIRIADGRVIGPNGTYMTYVLEHDPRDNEWRRRTRSGWRRIYGAALTENIVQYLSRIILSQAMLRVQDKHGFRAALCAHDELVYVAPDDQAEWLLAKVIEEMSRTPDWLPGIPLGAEGWISERYGK